VFKRLIDLEIVYRLEPVILELEREPADILFIGHGSVIRCLMAYLQVRCRCLSQLLLHSHRTELFIYHEQGLTPSEIPRVELRRGDVVQVTPSACKFSFLSLSLSSFLTRADSSFEYRWRQICQPFLLAVELGYRFSRML